MPRLRSDFSFIFVMGPCIPFLVSPETEDVGDACAGGALDLKGVID
jgi:hypothetical protein